MTDPLPRALTEADLPRAAALSKLIGWNQAEADWRLFLHHGVIHGVDDPGEALPATAAFIRYGAQVAWISMVLVRPDRRRRGLATRFMRWAVEALAGTPCAALDATPAGREVYRRLGFRDEFGFRRWALPEALQDDPGLAVRALRESDWPAIRALDEAAFGAPREFLLRDFAMRMPGAALVAEDGNGIAGFVLARDGVRSPQIGPVIARGDAAGRALIAAALAALPPPSGGQPRAVLDLMDARVEVAAWLRAQGATEQRPFTRMIRGKAPLPGDPSRLLAVAGPEFG